jgi:hypothetical protein
LCDFSAFGGDAAIYLSLVAGGTKTLQLFSAASRRLIRGNARFCKECLLRATSLRANQLQSKQCFETNEHHA